MHKCKPWLTALLSVIFPGLGHIYAGAARRGLLQLGLVTAALLIFGWTGKTATLGGFYLLIAITFAGFGWIVIDSILVCRRRQQKKKIYNRWPVYLIFALIMIFVQWMSLQYRDSVMGYQSFRLASDSMSPLLQEGDYVLVDTRHFQRREPAVGDVVVFDSVDKVQIYVKRIAAFGGDTIEIDNGRVLRNSLIVDSLSVPAERRKRPVSRSMEKTLVPPGHLFLLGDWRDNSRDSRYWGVLPEKNLIGTVKAIWYSGDWGRIGRVPR